MDMPTSPWSSKVLELHEYWLSKGFPEYRLAVNDRINELMKENKEWTLLDAGCGTGITYQLLPDEHRQRYTGVDKTPEMIQFCRKNHPEGDFKILNLEEEMPPKADITLTMNVLQHLENYLPVLQKLVTYTKEILLICETSHEADTIKLGDIEIPNWAFKPSDLVLTLDTMGADAEFKGWFRSVSGHETQGYYEVLT